MFTLEELYSIKSQDYYILASAKNKIDNMIEKLEEENQIKDALIKNLPE